MGASVHLAVISDLHLGRRDAAERFGHDDAEFVRFLQHLERNFERVVLLGDVYETLASPLPSRQVQELQAIRAAHPEVEAQLRRPAFTYLHGNHDIVTANLEGAASELELRADGHRIVFTHGHRYDWLIRRLRWASELSVWLGGWLLRLGLTPATKLMDYMDNVLNGVSKHPERCAFQRWAVGFARQRDADIVVTGHTHIGGRAEHGDRLFLNSGSCANGQFSFLTLDTAAGRFAHHTSW